MHLKQLRLGLRLTLHSELNAHSFVNLLMSCRSKVECQSTVCTVSGGPTKRLERTRHERASLVSCVGEPETQHSGGLPFWALGIRQGMDKPTVFRSRCD